MNDSIADINWGKICSVTPEAGSLVKIDGEIPYEILKRCRQKALKQLGQDISMDGFRPGHVPELILIEKIGEMAILDKMAELALQQVYPQIVEAHTLPVIDHPRIQITKLAKDNPLGFTIKVTVLPEVTLPKDYKDLVREVNAKKESPEVTDEEMDKQIELIMRQRLAFEKVQKKSVDTGAEATDSQTEATTLPTPESEAKKTEKKTDETTTDPLPELTDAYVQGLGQTGQFSTVAEFKEKIRHQMTIDKTRQTKADHRTKITNHILDKIKLELPEVLIDRELNQMLTQMKDNLKRNDLTLESYLDHVKKTETELKNEGRQAAEYRAKLQLVLNEIATVEAIKPDTEAVEVEVEKILEKHKQADEKNVRLYVLSVLTNDAVLKMLEEQ